MFVAMCENVDACEKYGTKEYLSTEALVVPHKYRGCGIGKQFCQCIKPFCETVGISLTLTSFTSNFSDRIADQMGYTIEKSVKYLDIKQNQKSIQILFIRFTFQFQIR